MKAIKYAILYGFLIWLIPFVVSFIIFPLRTSTPFFFETIMAVVIALCIVPFSVLYFKNVDTEFLKEGAILGIFWFAISLIIDLMLFMPESPMQMTFADYMMDIGLTYLMMPIITLGFAYLLVLRE